MLSSVKSEAIAMVFPVPYLPRKLYLKHGQNFKIFEDFIYPMQFSRFHNLYSAI